MNKHVWIIFTSLALFIVGVVAFWLIVARNRFAYARSQERTKSPLPAQPVEIVSASNEPQDGMNTRPYLGAPYERVNDRAAAIAGGDEKTIRELADAVLQLITRHSPPGAILSPFMKRVAQAEIDYRSGRKAGIPEANIVRVIDYLAAKLGAPNYARTDEDEVRDKRLSISQIMPNFIPCRPPGEGKESPTGSSYTVDPLMSPLEAVYVTHSLIAQKEISEFSLLTTEERADVKTAINQLNESGAQLTLRERAEVMKALIEQKLHPEKAQLTAAELAAEARRRSAESGNNQAETLLLYAPSSTRHKKMQEVFDRAYRMRVSDALELAGRSIELLDI
ncbi:MAG: hypothetical protein J2P52_11145 [Blastocatellia bacterium]|nr:hypothetical protein [Blastocatellia bacterium]